MTENEIENVQPESNMPETPGPGDEPEIITPPEEVVAEITEPVVEASEQLIEPDSLTEPEPKEEKKPPTRFQRFLRKLLIGLGVAVVLFLAGFLTYHFVLHKPVKIDLQETQKQLADANQMVSDLTTENANLTDLNQKSEIEIEALQTELSAVQANALFYQVLVDVNNARIALFLEDIEGAQAALKDTEVQLQELQPAIDNVDPTMAINLLARLELVISGLGRDQDTGLIDLELFTKALLELEPLLALN